MNFVLIRKKEGHVFYVTAVIVATREKIYLLKYLAYR